MLGLSYLHEGDAGLRLAAALFRASYSMYLTSTSASREQCILIIGKSTSKAKELLKYYRISWCTAGKQMVTSCRLIAA